MDIFEIVEKLCGPINPVGKTETDENRLENLKIMTELVDNLIEIIGHVARQNKDRTEHSMKVAGEHAHKFLISHWIEY